MKSVNGHQSTFDLLYEKVCSLVYQHQFYRSLYKPQNVAHMNQISGEGFRIIQDALVTDIIRQLCALADPATTGKRQNATLARMMDELATEHAKCHATCSEHFDSLATELEAARQHRNKRLAHFDLGTASGVEVLPPLLTDHVDNGVALVAKIMEVASPCFKQEVAVSFDMIIDGPNAIGKLSWLLSDGVRYKRLRELARDPQIDSDELRAMVSDRGGRADARRGG